MNSFREWLNSRPKVDLRKDYDEVANVTDGTLYRKGRTVQVWWVRDALGRPFEPPEPETWTFPDEQQAMAAFQRRME